MESYEQQIKDLREGKIDKIEVNRENFFLWRDAWMKQEDKKFFLRDCWIKRSYYVCV